MSCYYAGVEFQCNEKHCKGCIDASNYVGSYGKRIYMTDEEIEEVCSNCACYYECFDDDDFGTDDLEKAKHCYNIMFSCCKENRMKRINNYEYADSTVFGYDGCHKIYIAGTELAKKRLEEEGYTIYPIEAIKNTYDNSCPLKFIDEWDGTDDCAGFTTIIAQCTEDADIEWEGFDD